MDPSTATALQGAIESELARRFDLDDGTMAEYVVVMLQNGKDAQGVSSELNDLVSNFDPSFTDWVFEQATRLKSGQSVSFPSTGTAEASNEDQEMDMDTGAESNTSPNRTDDAGMGYPSSRLYSGLKKTLHDNNSEVQKPRYRPETSSVRSTPYGTVAVGNGAMKIPTGPRNSGPAQSQQRTGGAGPIRSAHQRQDRGNGRQQRNGNNGGMPEMSQFPGFPMPLAEFFANMPLMDRIGGIDGAPPNGIRPPTRRCTKWPTCYKGKACTFGHPTSICQNPNCRKTDGSCPNVHADEDVDLLSGVEAQRKTEEEQEAKAAARENRQQRPQYRQPRQPAAVDGDAMQTDGGGGQPICKFGEACTNRSCHFSHPSPASKDGSSIVLSADACPAGMDCKDAQCSFGHPSPSNKYTPGVKLNAAALEIGCKFHPCLNPSCRFQHAPGQQGGARPAFGGARNKVWTPATASAAKGTAERSFVDGEAEEQFGAASNVHDNDSEMIK